MAVFRIFNVLVVSVVHRTLISVSGFKKTSGQIDLPRCFFMYCVLGLRFRLLRLEIVETANKWVSQPERSAVRLVDEYIESNKVYEIETDEDGDTVRRVAGIKDEQLERVLKHLKTSLERDGNDLSRYNAEISSKGEHQLSLIKKIVQVYGNSDFVCFVTKFQQRSVFTGMFG